MADRCTSSLATPDTNPLSKVVALALASVLVPRLGWGKIMSRCMPNRKYKLACGLDA